MSDDSCSNTDDTASVCSEATIDDVWYNDNDPLFEDAWTDVWNARPRHTPLAEYLDARPLSQASQDRKWGATMRDFKALLTHTRRQRNTEIFKMRCQYLRQY